MKKNPFLQGAAWLVAITMLAVCAIAGNTTMALYTAEASGSGSASVAKWAILINGENIAGTVPIVPLHVSLIDTITCFGGTTDADPDVAEDHVAGNFFAPGTKGSLRGLVIENVSDVTAQVTLTATIEFNNVAADQTIIDLLEDRLLFDGKTFGQLKTEVGAVAPLAAAVIPLDPGESYVFGDENGFEWSWAFAGESVAGIDNQIGAYAYENGGLDLITATFTVDVIQVN